MCLSKSYDNFSVDFSRFSTYGKLFRVLMCVFSAIHKFKKKSIDLEEIRLKAFNYMVQYEQSSSFDQEINFLSNSLLNAKEIPKLVSNLNLFLDKDRILRSKGRIDKNTDLSFNAINPIVLKKDTHFTKFNHSEIP